MEAEPRSLANQADTAAKMDRGDEISLAEEETQKGPKQ